MPTAEERDLARERKTVRELDGLSRAMVELLSLFYDGTGRTDLARGLGKLGHRVDGRAIGGPDILPLLEALSARGIVEGAPAYTVTRDLAHAATLAALE